MDSILEAVKLQSDAYLLPQSILSPAAAVALIVAILFYVLYVTDLSGPKYAQANRNFRTKQQKPKYQKLHIYQRPQMPSHLLAI